MTKTARYSLFSGDVSYEPRKSRRGPTGFRQVAGPAVALASLFCVTAANAQVLDTAPKPVINATDDAGVDLKSGKVIWSAGELSIGNAESPAFSFGIFTTTFFVSGSPTYGVVTEDCGTYNGMPGCIYLVRNWNLAGTSEVYSQSPPSYSGAAPNSTEQGSLVSGGSTLYRKDGSVWQFGNAGLAIPNSQTNVKALVTSITYPTGEILTFNYSSGELRSVVSNSGYMLHFEGYYPSLGYWPAPNIQMSSKAPDRVVLINLSTDYCAPLATSCPGLTVNWPAMTYTGSAGYQTATDHTGRAFTKEVSSSATVNNQWNTQFKFTTPGGYWLEYKLNVQGPYGNPYNYCDARSKLEWLKSPVGQWNYGFSFGTNCKWLGVSGGTSTAPDGTVKQWNGGFIDELNRKTTYTSIGYSNMFSSNEIAVSSITKPEGDQVTFTYDNRRNLIQSTAAAKPGTSQTITASASYASTCTVATAKVCNQPDYTIDANGKRTDYTYDPVHGGVLTQTLPADANGVRPQTRYTYAAQYAQVRTYVGSPLTTLTTPIYKLVQTSTCSEALASNPASCVGTDKELVTTYEYNNPNLLLTATTVKAGNNTLTSRIEYGYDVFGNRIWVDGPRTDVDDRSYVTYTALRQKVFEIGPDPDGAGTLRRTIVRHVYNADGHETRTETGDGLATDGSDFVVRSYVAMEYDTAGRLTKKISAQP